MTTKIYGASDDLIEFEGDVDGEIGSYARDEDKHGTLIVCSDGTILEAKYGKGDMGVWGIAVIKRGMLFESHTPCLDEDADPHSDVVAFKDHLMWAYAASEWERVK